MAQQQATRLDSDHTRLVKNCLSRCHELTRHKPNTSFHLIVVVEPEDERRPSVADFAVYNIADWNIGVGALASAARCTVVVGLIF